MMTNAQAVASAPCATCDCVVPAEEELQRLGPAPPCAARDPNADDSSATSVTSVESEDEEDEVDEYGDYRVYQDSLPGQPKRADVCFRKGARAWAHDRWAQTRRQLWVFTHDESYGYADVADAAANLLNPMYGYCADRMDTEDDPFKGDYEDFAGATLWCVLGLQQAWAEETRISNGWEVGDAVAQAKWSLANMHAALAEGHKGEKFESHEGGGEEGGDDMARTYIGSGQKGRRSKSGVNSLGRTLHNRSSTAKQRRMRVDHLCSGPKLSKQVALFHKVWRLVHHRPMNADVAAMRPPSVFLNGAASSSLAQRFTGTFAAKSDGWSQRVNEASANAAFGICGEKMSLAAAAAKGTEPRTTKPAKQVIVIEPSPSMAQKRSAKEMAAAELKAEFERESAEKRRRRELMDMAEQERMIFAAARSVTKAAIAKIINATAMQYHSFRWENDMARAKCEVEMRVERKQAMRDRVMRPTDDIFPEMKEVPALVAALTDDERKVLYDRIPSIDERAWEMRQEKPYEAPPDRVYVRGGVDRLLKTVSGKERKRQGGGPKPKPKPTEPPADDQLAMRYGFKTGDEMHAYMKGMRARNTDPHTGCFGGFTTRAYEAWELDMWKDVLEWLPKAREQWEAYVAEQEAKKKKRDWERNPHDPAVDFKAYSDRVNKNTQDKEAFERRQRDRANRKKRAADHKQGVAQRNVQRKEKKEETQKTEAAAKRQRVVDRAQASMARANGTLKNFIAKERAASQKAVEAYESKYMALHMKGKGGVLQKPRVDPNTGLFKRDEHGVVETTLTFVPATGRNTVKHPWIVRMRLNGSECDADDNYPPVPFSEGPHEEGVSEEEEEDEYISESEMFGASDDEGFDESDFADSSVAMSDAPEE